MSIKPTLLKWKDFSEIISRLERGEVACCPTESVVGIMANPSLEHRINNIKKSPRDKPLARIIGNRQHLQQLWPNPHPSAEKLSSLWPGPLTLISGPGPGLAFRMPDVPELLKLLESSGPLLASSANFSGAEAPAHLKDVDPDFIDAVDFVIDEQCDNVLNQASTILKFNGDHWKILREGPIKREQLLPHVEPFGLGLEF